MPITSGYLKRWSLVDIGTPRLRGDSCRRDESAGSRQQLRQGAGESGPRRKNQHIDD